MTLPLLAEYLRKNMALGIIDHSLRATVNDKGEISFYIHPDGKDGETLDVKFHAPDPSCPMPGNICPVEPK